jgi:tyrosine-protein kinase Etk/Wzc
LDQPTPLVEPASPMAPEPVDEISLLDLLIRILRQKRFVIKVTLATALLGGIVALILPDRFTAMTVILPPQQGSSSGAALLAQLGSSLGPVASLAGAGLGGLKNPNDLQVAMLKSRVIEDAMIDRFHLMTLYRKKRRSDARKKFESYVEIDSGTKDGLIHISVTDRDANRAAEMANGYVEEFKKRSSTLAVGEASQRRLFFEQQLVQAKDNLAKSEEDLKKTEQTTGLIQLDSQARAVIELVAQLRAQIAAKEVQIRAMRSFATGDNPDVQMAEQELAGLRVQQEKMGATEGASNELLIPKGNMQQAGLEYVRKLRDVKYFETIFNLLARQYEAAKVDEARQGALVQVVDPAIAPDRHSSPMRTLIVLGSAFFGLLGGVLWVLAAEGMGHLSRNPAERERLDTLKMLFSRRES